ncbi:MAG: DUF6273 domain-containing protein [Oscillospiraceae bacterium]|jgi:hypothetical protein|nr:DUF6273 domain-containing protein [Oscillospiraceae bacterium]
MKSKKNEILFDRIGFVDDALIEEAAAYVGIPQGKKSRFRFNYVYASLAAMCAVMLVLTGVLIYIYNTQPPIEDEPSVTDPVPEIGDIIQFGDYDWRVLDVQDGKALIITENMTEGRTYHSDYVEMTWEKSDIRAYLNSEFYNRFSSEERERITETTVINNDNSRGIPGGNDTVDRIFLLSIDEAHKYFADDSARIVFNADSEPYSWWLRSPGFNAYMAAQVKSDGSVFIDVNNQDINNVLLGVRPAMWVRFAPPVEPAIGYTWVVEPTLEYDWVNYCTFCDVFIAFINTESENYSTIIIDEAAQPTGEIHEPHPKYSMPGERVWVYDPDLDLFGWFQHINLDVGAIYELYPMNEFTEHFPKESDRIRTVRRYDTTMSTRGYEFFPGQGYSGDAVMYGNEFITDFIYPMQSKLGRQQMNIISIHDGDGNDGSNYGIMNKDGVLIVPFESWLLVTISETTAFANKNGKWGIIGFNGYVADETQMTPQPAEPAQPQTVEEILTEFMQRICSVRGMLPYFNDINDVELRTILQQYFNVYGWDWSDTDVFSDGQEQHHYNDDEVEQLKGRWYFGSVLGISPSRLEKYMQEYYNPYFSIESYDYKNMSTEDGVTWDNERELIVGSVYGGGLHMSRSTHIVEINEPEIGIYSVYALKAEWGENAFRNMEYIHCTFTQNVNENFNVMSKQLVPESEYPEWVSEFFAFIDGITNDIDVAYEYAIEFDVFAEMDEKRQCSDCYESNRNSCDGCIVNAAIEIIFREAFQMFKDRGVIYGQNEDGRDDLLPLKLLGYAIHEGEMLILQDNWTDTLTTNDFRRYFFGTWEKTGDKDIWNPRAETDESTLFTIDDTIDTRLHVQMIDGGFHDTGHGAIVYIVSGGLVNDKAIYWIEFNNPDVLYYTSGYNHNDFNERYGDVYRSYDFTGSIFEVSIYRRTNAPIAEPTDGYLSNLRLREISEEYGIWWHFLTWMTLIDEEGEQFRRDDQLGFFPIFLVSEEPDKLVFKTQVSWGLYEVFVDVIYTIERINGEWVRTIESDVELQEVKIQDMS